MADEPSGVSYPVCRGDRDNVIDLRPARLKLTVASRLGWRIPDEDRVRGARVSVLEGVGDEAVSIVDGVTDAEGFVELIIPPSHVSGDYTLSIQPEHAWPWDREVGPELVGGQSPDRIWRPHEERVRLECGVIEPPPPALARGYCTNLTNRPSVGLHVDGGRREVLSGRHDYVALLQPVWMYAPGQRQRTQAVSLVVIHHTGSNPNTSNALRALLGDVSTHYVVDLDGQIIKLVNDDRVAWHAGESFWRGESSLNASSIGIDMVEVNDGDSLPVADRTPFTAAQYEALIRLIEQLRAAHPTISAHSVVGHGDVALIVAGDDTRLGNKFKCPGAHFDWSILDAHGLGLVPRLEARDLTQAYRGYFAACTEPLRKDDDDAQPQLGGRRRDQAFAGVIRELQTDLAAIGYFVNETGRFDDVTKAAVAAFNIHFRSMYEGRSRPDPKQRVDAETASLIKRVVPL